MGNVSAVRDADMVEGSGARVSSICLTGLDCADCAAKLENKIRQLKGVRQARLNFGTAKMTVEHDINLDKIIRTIEDAGYGVRREETAAGAEIKNPENRKVMLTAVSGGLAGSGFVLSFLGVPETVTVSLYLLSILTGGFYAARSGLYSLKSLSPDMNFLMTIAVIGAAATGDWFEGAAVVFLYSLGSTLQNFTMEKTRNSIRALMDLAPKEALVRREGKESTLPLSEIKVGDILIVKPGERIAMDGRVISGVSGVNQAPITGESMPVAKKPGDEVFAGTINEQGALDIEVTKLVQDTTLAKIIQLVEEAQAQKAPSQQFIDRFARYYTPAVILAAAAFAVLPPLFFAQPFEPWFKKALILLVISCPCALVISTPVTIVAAIGSGARRGVLIKGGAYLEAAGSLKVMAFDKTGTLTTGRPEVTDVIPAGDKRPEEVMELAAVIESRSQHPLAGAVLRYVRDKGIIIREGTDFESLTGKGARAVIAGKAYYIGSPGLFEKMGIGTGSLQPEIDRLQKTGKTVMLVGSAEELYGLAAVTDVVRESAVEAVKKLKEAGIKKVIMLTGDNRETAGAIAGEVGVDEFRAELLPEDKLTVIRELLARYGRVGMVGDGVNDAPALAAATVGIAMGGAGTDTALETADIALMADDLAKLPYAMKLSRRALRVIRQNITLALAVQGLFILLTAFGLVSLWMAVVFADTGLALVVILNGMRLLKVAEEK